MENSSPYSVAVVGAGPAGLFAARELANQGVHVVIFNRDIKPGGLAEYGIYPDKVKMKVGLRNQFKQTLAMPEVEYYGNITVGTQADLTLEQIWAMGFQAILVTAGAQGTKWLGLPGEGLRGVYHAKDIVYHYNNLPPFSEHEFSIGKRVAIIGIGNVMIDIARYLIHKRNADEVVTFARRGPMEIKFDRHQLEYIASSLNLDAYDREVKRVTPILTAVGQDPEIAQKTMHEAVEKIEQSPSSSCLWFRFLSSPAEILDNGQGGVGGIKIEDTTLIKKGEDTKAVGLGTYKIYEVDTVIFAIGDTVDGSLGLPVQNQLFSKNPNPCFPIEGVSYEVWDPEQCQPKEGMFVAGWSRKASDGLVGIARRDGVNGAQVVMQYLQSRQFSDQFDAQKLHDALNHLGHPVVNKEALPQLEAVERVRTKILGVEDFKFSTNHEMLEAMQLLEKEA